MKNGSSFGFILAGIVVVVGGGVAGYYFMNPSATSKEPPVVATTDVTSAPTAAPAPAVHRPIAAAGEYTAPGAPTIAIKETKVAEVPKTTPAVSPEDSEASETGVMPPPAIASPTADTDMGASSAAPADTTPDPAATPTAAGTPTSTSASSAPPSAPASDQPPTGQDPDSVAPPPAAPSVQGLMPPSVLYHVEAGAFQSEKNANILEDALRHRGYTASTLHNSVDGQDMFVVQVGAYRNKVTADEVAADLQQNGFPASVSHTP